MATLQLPTDFVEFLRLLNSEKVEYLLVGGYAVIYHGYVRSTNDMDIWVKPDLENAAKVAKTLVSFGFSSDSIKPEMFINTRKVFQMGIVPFRIDVLTYVSGLEFDQAYPRRIIVPQDDYLLNIICLDDLRANKQASGRGKDLVDIEHLQ